MANFFEGVGNLLMHPVNEAKWMFDTTKDVIKGDMKLKDIPGSHQEMMNDITVPILGDNKLSKNSDAVAGAVVGGILAAPLLAGAGGGAAGGAAGGGTGASSSVFSLGDIGGYLKPNKTGALGGKKPGGGVLDSAFNFDGGIKNPSFGSDVGFKPGKVTEGMELMENGGKYNPTTEFGGAKPEKGPDWEAFARMLQTIKPPQDQKINLSGGRTGGGGFRFDRKPYENQLLTREYEALYNQPLYSKLT
ncbi:MAG: hypothetical protein ACRDCE_15115 [Cetobacterium sp.]|uniref:hypothetical protein n=1 Tax=Cetobacterium sp. TaxID=2071632 RepID=UPI003EE55957